MHSKPVVERLLLGIALLGFSIPLANADEAKPAGTPGKVSYFKDIRPLFQVHCQGCHQPAKPSGQYVMTTFERLVKGGDSKEAAVVAGDPEKSNLHKLIVPIDGEAEMPKGKKPLADVEIALVKRWIAEGAADDTPASAKVRFDMDHPPTYTRPPVVTSMDFSPDGKLLAISGFNEVLLTNADGSGLAGRLVGLSERIESVRFSPDGKRLAVTGGKPGRMGEIQIWDVENKKLTLSLPMTYDTVYGGSWSPDGKFVAFGCSDNSVRAINAQSGEQVLFQGAHTDWVRDTVFSKDGSHVVSVGRDMTSKLTEVATQRFIDNVTSITPGALKGGIQSVARHPERDEIVIGGSDGTVKVYRMHRLTKRVIGDDANMIRTMPPMTGRIFSVAVSQDGKRIAAGSSLDGTGEVAVYSYEFDTSLPDNLKKINEKIAQLRSEKEHKELADYHSKDVKLIARAAIQATGIYAVAFSADGKTVAASGGDGIVRLIDAAAGSIVKEFSPAPVGSAQVAAATPTAPAQVAAPPPSSPTAIKFVSGSKAVDFIRDVAPVLSRMGCNAGTCHGSAKGRNGFKLSLRGYDPIFDVRALADDLAARRINVASPDDSLMLLKNSGEVPHEGGVLARPGDPYYQIIRDWIAAGAKLDLAVPRVAKIEVTPQNPIVEKVGSTLPMKVVATYTDGATRDVTAEAFIESGNGDVLVAEPGGVMKAARRGEAPVLVRYEGAYAATTLTVMGDRSGFEWKEPPAFGKIDELTAAKWKHLKIQPSELCSDADFVRRVTLDLTGLPPTADDVRAFLADTRDQRDKREALIDKLIGSDAYVDYWTNKWADLLMVNGKYLGKEGAASYRGWIREQIAKNVPYDQFARSILTATGSNRENPAASYYKILRDPGNVMENTTHVFLAVRFNCNKCHDHPFERWTQDQYYQTAAYFAQVEITRDPESKARVIGGTAVEGAKPIFEFIKDKKDGEVTHERTGKVTPPEFPFPVKFEAPKDATRRQLLANWLTSADNIYFAKSYVNRLWGYLFGVGIVEPLDDIRAGNPPTNPELLDYLTREFIQSGFNARHVMKLICSSRTYQLSLETNKWNQDDKINFAHALARRLPAEVLYDAVYQVVGAETKIPGVKPGTRAAALPDSGIDLPSGFLGTLGRPPRESGCECERSSNLQLGPVMALISGPTLAEAISDPNNALVKLAKGETNDEKLFNEMFLRVLNRPAKPEETKSALDALNRIDADHARLAKMLADKEAEFIPVRQKLIAEREAAIVKAQADLAAFEKESAPKVAQKEKERLEKIAKSEKSIADYKAAIDRKAADWEKKLPVSRLWSTWTVLDPKTMTANGTTKLAKQSDLSLLVSGPVANDNLSDYSITAETDVAGITGLLLEVLPDESQPGFGPGRHESGNFVLSELRVQSAPKATPNQQTAVAFSDAAADFVQDQFNIKQVYDGKADVGGVNGWAIGGTKQGQPHWAALKLEKPVGDTMGTILSIRLEHRFADGFAIGKFRLWVSTSPDPLHLGLPVDVSEIVKAPPALRKKEQTERLVRYFEASSTDLLGLQQGLAVAKRPVPTDPKLIELRGKVTQALQPVRDDAALIQLRADLTMSLKQIEDRRLTAVQDLAWALINSPEFLFNH